jgi:hypothetical protein
VPRGRPGGVRAVIDAIVVNVRDGAVANRPIYTAVVVTTDGERDILGRHGQSLPPSLASRGQRKRGRAWGRPGTYEASSG